MELNKIRKRIDETDEKIVALIEERFNLAREVADYKKERALPILDKEREREVIDRSASYLSNAVDGENIKDIFERIMSISRNIQREIIVDETTSIFDILGDLPVSSPVTNPRVGFQGVVGSYSEEALNGFFPIAEKMNFPKFVDVVVALLAGEIDYGIFPIENTSTGGVLEVERLLEQHPVYIVGEQVVPINHCLLGVGEISDITTVYSHAQGFLQCAPYLEEQNWNLIPYFNTATSAKLVAEKKDKKIAAIASRRAAEVYGLKILGEGINYNNKNYTRFVVLKPSMEVKKTNDKISIQFILDHTEGALYRVIKSITENHLNMSKIESKPIVGVPWEYTFFIDFAGNIEEPNVMRALMEVKENSREFQFKGNYTGYRSMI